MIFNNIILIYIYFIYIDLRYFIEIIKKAIYLFFIQV